MRPLLIIGLLLASAAVSRAQSITDSFSFPISIRAAGIHGVARYAYIPARADSSAWTTFPSRMDARAFRSGSTVTRRGDSIIWASDSDYMSPEGNHSHYQNTIFAVLDSVQMQFRSLGVSLLTSEFQQAYLTDRTRSYTFVGHLPYTLTDTGLVVSLSAADLRTALRRIDYADRTTALLQGQLSGSFVTGFDSLALDDTARLLVNLAKVIPAAVGSTPFSSPVGIYPNPADRFVIAPSRKSRIFDLLGRPVMVNGTESDRDIRFDVSALPAGVYLIEADGRRSRVTVQHQ